MSHTVTIKSTITSIDCLKKSVASLKGLEFREGKSKFKTYGSDRKCDHAIGLVNSKGMGFEVGVIHKATAKNEYELAFDSMDSALAEVVGYQCEHLIQGYAAQLVLQEMPFGWDYTTTKQSNGDVIMELSH